jgi:TolA-binding protein
MALPWDKIIGGAVTLGSALLGTKAANTAAKTTQQAAATAAQGVQAASGAAQDEIRRQFETTRGDMAPWRAAGTNALALLTRLNTPGGMAPGEVEGQLRGLPGFAFQEQELQKQIDRRHAGSGNRFSGRGMKEATRWMNDALYQPTYRNWMSDLETLAGYGRDGNQTIASMGGNAASSIGTIGTNAAGAIGSAGITAADAAAQAGLAKSGIWNNALQTLASDLMPNPYMKAYYGR